MKADSAEREVLAGCLRDRVAQGRYREAERALADYCAALMQAAAGLAPGDPGLGVLEAEWRGLAEETRRRVLAGRAHAASRLAKLAQTPGRTRSYGEGPPAGSNREWRA